MDAWKWKKSLRAMAGSFHGLRCMPMVIALVGLATSIATVHAQNASALRTPRHGGIHVIAHRGAHQGIPENTLAAYRRAIELGCDWIEVDVRTTSDGQLVSIHDATIDRYVSDGSTGRVASMTLEELQMLDIGSRIDPKWREERIPTLREIFDVCSGKIGVYLDVKQASIEAIDALVREFAMAGDVVWYISESRVERLHEIDPATRPMPDPGPEENLLGLLERRSLEVIASSWKHFSAKFADACHRQRVQVFVDDEGPATWETLIVWGADGIQTDFPEALIAWLRKREAASGKQSDRMKTSASPGLGD